MRRRAAAPLLSLLTLVVWLVTSLSAFGAAEPHARMCVVDAPMIHAVDAGLGSVVLAAETVEPAEAELEADAEPPTPSVATPTGVIGADTGRTELLLARAAAALAPVVPVTVLALQLPRTRHDRRVQGARAPPLA